MTILTSNSEVAVQERLLESITTGLKDSSSMLRVEMSRGRLLRHVKEARALRYVAASIDISPPSLSASMPAPEGGQQLSTKITSSATGSVPLVISSISVVGESFMDWIEADFDGPVSLPSGQSYELKFHLTKRAEELSPGDYFAAFELHHNAPSGAHTVTIALSIPQMHSPTTASTSSADQKSSSEQDLWDKDFFEERFLQGLAAGLVGAVVLFCIFKVCARIGRRICCCFACCGKSRAAELSRGGHGKFEQIGTGSSTLGNADPGNRTGSNDDEQGIELGNSFGIRRPAARKAGNTGDVERGLAAPQRAPAKVSFSLTLDPAAAVDASQYEATWQRMDMTRLWGGTLSENHPEEVLTEALEAISIKCMASGAVDGKLKLYFYAGQASHAPPRLFMVETTATASERHLSCVFKTNAQGDPNASAILDSFISMFCDRLRSRGLIL
eukprot:g2526.t1